MTAKNSSNQSTAHSDIRTWLVKWIAEALELSSHQINTSNSLLEYSLSSMTAMMLVGDLEEWLKIEIPPTLVWDYPSIDALVDYLFEAKNTKLNYISLTEAEETKHINVNESPSINSSTAQVLPDNIDELSEEEMDALLSELLQ